MAIMDLRPPALPPPNTVPIHVRIPDAVDGALRRIADQHGSPYSHVVRWVLEEGLRALGAMA
jgi:hypothetical protein